MSAYLHGSVALLLLAVLAACTNAAQPSPTPRDFTAVLENLALRGATIHEAVSGDAGCPAVPLHGNAVRLELTLAEDDSDYEVFLFRWRRAGDYEAAAEEFEACLEDYARSSVGVFVEVVELSPWRAYGPGWSDQLMTTLEEALRAAGGSG